MKIKKVHFRNWCQYRDATVEFADGLTAIKGTNGRGKTNLVNGIVFSLTGDCSRNPGVKADNINRNIKDREPAFVETTFEHGGAVATITRNLKGGQELRIGNEVLTYDKEVSKKMREILGVSETILLDYIFVEQGKIFSFIAQKPTERAAAYAQLFQTDRAEALWKMMGEYKIDIPSVSVGYDAAKTQIAHCQLQLKDIESRLSKYSHLPKIFYREQLHESKIIAAWKLKGDMENEARVLKNRAQRYQQELEPMEAQLLNAKTDEETLKGVIDDAKKDAVEAEAVIKAWHEYELAFKQSDFLQSRAAKLKNEFFAKPTPVAPANWALSNAGAIESNQFAIGQLGAEIQALDTFVRTAQSGAANCPTCGTLTDLLKDNISDYAAERDVKYKQQQRLIELDRASQRYLKEQSAYDWSKKEYEKENGLLQRQIQELKVPEGPAKNRAWAKQAVDDYELYRRGLSDANKTRTDCEVSMARLKGMHAEAEASWKDAEKKFNDIKVTAEDAAAAINSLNEIVAQVNIRDDLVNGQKTYENMLRLKEHEIKEWEELRAKSVRRQHLADHIAEVRAPFHRDNLPKKVAQAYLDTMRGEINDVLGSFGSPFSIDETKDLQFTVRKPDGSIEMANRLSFGEKVVFAISFRIVVNSIFAKDLGLLCLDEPTAGLDDDNLACMETALGRLRELSKSRDLQVIIITHEKGMDSLFDRVVELPLDESGE